MRLRPSATVLFLLLSACSSTNEPPGPVSDALPPVDATEASIDSAPPKDAATEEGGEAAPAACIPRRDTVGPCGFGPGSLIANTLGSCTPTGSKLPVEHIILLFQQGRSFDHYLGHLKGNGQDDVDVPPDGASNPSAGDSGPPVPWHHLDDYCFDEPTSEWEGSHLAWNQGKNDGFVSANVALPGDGGFGEAGPGEGGASDAGSIDAAGSDPTGARAMGYYDKRDIPFYYELASTFAISDRYFSDMLGPSLPNRLYSFAGTSFGLIRNEVDMLDHRTIFRVLNERNISWKIYTSDVAAVSLILGKFLDDANGPAGNPDASLDGASEGGGIDASGAGPDGALDGGAGRVVPIAQFAADAAAGTLPKVAWIDPMVKTGRASRTSEHPPANVQVGQKFVYDQVQALLTSRSWGTSVMFVTHDGPGGLYDHVAPPFACPPDPIPPSIGPFSGGFDNYGFRVPVFVVSPFAKKHFVSHATHSHTSILRFIEAKFDLPALSRRDANSDAMLDMFDFENPPFMMPPSLTEPPIDMAKLDACKAKFGP